MTTINLAGDRLQVRFRPLEKLLGLLSDLDVPTDAIGAVTVEPDGLAAAKGIRAPGLGIPGVRKLGTWRGRHRKAMVSVRRGQPAVRITLAGEKYDELVLGTDDAAVWADRLRPAPR
ncbi:MAG: hypothetical protein ACTHKG_15945 [Nocardioides sp.]